MSEGSFVCNMCDYSFAYEELVIAHNRIHVKKEKNSTYDEFEVSIPRTSISEIKSQSSICVKEPCSSVKSESEVSTLGTSNKPSISDAFSQNSSSVKEQCHLGVTNNLLQQSNTRCGERNPRNFVCGIWQKGFKHQNSLRDHCRVHISDTLSQSSSLIKEPCSSFHSASRVSTPGTSNQPSISDTLSRNSSSAKEQCHLGATNNLLQQSNTRCGKRNPRNFVCGICQKGFKHQNSLRDHCRVHISGTLSQSSSLIKEPCSSFHSASTPGTSNQPSISDTLSRNSSSAKEQCHLGATNNLLQQFNTRCGKRNPRNFVCGICQKGFKQQNSLSDHCRVHIKSQAAVKVFFFDDYSTYSKAQRPKYCDICCMIFKIEEKREKHFNAIHKMNSHRCDECGQSYDKFNKLATHIRHFHKEKLVRCDVCSKGFLKNSDLKSHYRIHVGKMLEEKCKTHFNAIHKMNSHRCNECGQSYDKLSKLATHIRHFHEEKLVRCDVCSKGFLKNSDLKSHYRIHVGKMLEEKCKTHFNAIHKMNSHPCDECGQSYDKFSKLATHAHCSHKQKLVRCDVCFKGFLKNSSLKRHYRIHIGKMLEEKRKTHFNARTITLNARTMTIHKMNSHRCNECGQSYDKLSQLATHTRRFHEEKLIRCDVCSKGFLRNLDLKHHYSIHVGKNTRRWYMTKSEPLIVKKDPVLAKEREEPMLYKSEVIEE